MKKIAQGRLGDEHEVDRQLTKGDLEFVLLGQSLLGRWVLACTRGIRRWRLIKHKDEYASGEDVTVSKRLWVVSGRSMAKIGRAVGPSPSQRQQAAGADPIIPPLRTGSTERGGGDAEGVRPVPLAGRPAGIGSSQGATSTTPLARSSCGTPLTGTSWAARSVPSASITRGFRATCGSADGSPLHIVGPRRSPNTLEGQLRVME